MLDIAIHLNPVVSGLPREQLERDEELVSYSLVLLCRCCLYHRGIILLFGWKVAAPVQLFLLLAQGEALGRLEKTPRTIKDLAESLRRKTSRVLAPFGQDLENAPSETRPNGGECLRRLLCYRFEVEYASLPLGSRKLQAFALEACKQERMAQEEPGGCTADDLAEDLQRASEARVWLQLFLTPI